MAIENGHIPVSISFGISSMGDAGVNNPQSLLRKADELLYSAKEQKKFYVSGNTVWVRTHDDREPDSDFRVLNHWFAKLHWMIVKVIVSASPPLAVSNQIGRASCRERC